MKEATEAITMQFKSHWQATGAITDMYGQSFVKSIGAIQSDAIDYDDVASNIYWSINGQ